jgi:threonine/homoserine/homoserine lactone efflux protein
MNEYLLFFIGMALMVMAHGPDFMNVVGQSLRGNLRTGVIQQSALEQVYVCMYPRRF